MIQANKGFKPSSEIKMHMRVYQKRPDVGAVVHAHPTFATAFAIAGIPLTQPIMPEAVIALGCVPIAEYGTPSTMEIPDNLEKYLPYFDAVLLENHGALTWSTDLLAAYHKMESVESVSYTHLEAFGIFAGTAVNDTSSVTATASTWDSMWGLGSQTLDTAVTVKLTRTLAIIPITLVLAFIRTRKEKLQEGGKKVDLKQIFPMFILYFVLALSLIHI